MTDGDAHSFARRRGRTQRLAQAVDGSRLERRGAQPRVGRARSPGSAGLCLASPGDEPTGPSP
jgi:hypothetical protein